jgi:hypothetical protein
MIHSWSFARITEGLKRNLAQLGWQVSGKNSRVQAVPESWTSIICWRCGRKGIRPKQNLFICSCGNKCNADKNGAINIAGRLITLTSSLHDVRGLGKWTRAVSAAQRAQPKARRKSRSEGRSLLSKRGAASHRRESAAVHSAQTSLFDFGDETGENDDGPAVVKDVEEPTTAELDVSASKVEEGSQDRKRSSTPMMPDKDSSSSHSARGDCGDTKRKKGGTRKLTTGAHSPLRITGISHYEDFILEIKMVRPPGIEPGSQAWKYKLLIRRIPARKLI